MKTRVLSGTMCRALIAASLALALTAPAVAKTKVQFWHGWGSGAYADAMRRLVAEFNESQPDIEVQESVFSPFGELYNKITVAVAGGTAPDVVIYGRGTPAVPAYLGGVLQPIDQYPAFRGIDKNSYFAAPWQQAAYQGRQLGVPFNNDHRLMYYNMNALSQAGMDVQTLPETWDGLRPYLQKLTRVTGDLAGRIGFDPLGGGPWVPLYFWQHGGDTTSADGRRVTLLTPANLATVAWLEGLYDLQGGYDFVRFISGQKSSFAAGSVALMMDGDWTVRNLVNQGFADFATGPIPYMAATPSVRNRVAGHMLAIPTGAKHPEEALRFMAWMTSPAAMETFARIAYSVPSARKAAAALSEKPGALDKRWVNGLEYLEYAYPEVSSPVRVPISDDLPRVLSKQVTAESLFTSAEREWQAKLNELLAGK